jgi:hypothetical protein
VTLFPVQLAHMQYFPISEEDDFTWSAAWAWAGVTHVLPNTDRSAGERTSFFSIAAFFQISIINFQNTVFNNKVAWLGGLNLALQ